MSHRERKRQSSRHAQVPPVQQHLTLLAGHTQAGWFLCLFLVLTACRQSLAYLCAVTRLALTLEFQALATLDGLSAILGCPVHMPHLAQLHQPALLAAFPHQQWLICSSLLLAINWLRELLNAWAYHIQPHE